MKKTKSGLFLMELVLAILLFALSSAVCMQIFVKAHTISKETQELNRCVTICANAAELFYGTDGDFRVMCENLDPTKLGDSTEGRLLIYFTEDFENCTSKKAKYSLTVIKNNEDNLRRSSIVFEDREADKVLYSLNCSKFYQE